MRLAFIGGGNMARAIIKTLLDSPSFKEDRISVSDVNARHLKDTFAEIGLPISSNNLEVIQGADVVLLAVKPQNLEEIATDINGKLKPGQMVISILAGISIARLSARLGHQIIVRAMPNTPAQIGMGMTVWCCSEKVSDKQKEITGRIFSAMGRAIQVADEKYIDMATAISGSGPAYFFYFMESLTEAAISLGFSPQAANELVMQTALGSTGYAASAGLELAELRRRVTSPGGTTAEAIKVFESGQLKQIIIDAACQAHKRAKEMGES